jgi:hypothetical protein
MDVVNLVSELNNCKLMHFFSKCKSVYEIQHIDLERTSLMQDISRISITHAYGELKTGYITILTTHI